jgi:membrane protein YdbS with pleckstrin-like domain
MSFESVDPGEGHSLAAWTSIAIMLVAIAVGTVAFFLDVQWLVWASVVLLVLGLVAGLVLARLGYGASDVTSHEGH